MYDKELHPLLDIAGFNARYDEIRPQFKTDRRAWETVEGEVVAKYNHPKYKTFHSFKAARHRWQRDSGIAIGQTRGPNKCKHIA